MSRFGPGLEWLEARVDAESRRLRARYQLSMDELRGMFISDAMVDAFLAADCPPAQVEPPPNPVEELVDGLFLDRQAEGALLILLAPELDPRFWTFYAYLNDDASRRWPTPDLVGRLLGTPAEAMFAPASPLVRLNLAVADPADSGRPLRLRGWRPAPALVHRAIGLPEQHSSLLSTLKAAPAVAPLQLTPPWPALLVTGQTGTGRTELAAAHAAAAGFGALLFDATRAGEARSPLLAEAAVAARLDRAMLVVVADEVEAWPIGADDIPIAIVTNKAGAWAWTLQPRLVLPASPGAADPAARAGYWRKALRDVGLPAPRGVAEAAAARFRLPPPAIARAARRAAADRQAGPVRHRVLEAARAEAAADPGPLARRIAPSCDWRDLVLPSAAMRQLRDFAGAIERRERVFGEWGFASVGRATGRGLAALFSGGSGTGKTLSASVVAQAAGLDLWKIDLSAMVSKYIGETEKNLERLFSTSGASDSILFFDEADAIFGARSEVKDAHDRYSNIELAYLLQRIEEFEGVVVLATNLSRNIDTAFMRRIPFVIDFPMPDAGARSRLWRLAIPLRAPLCANVDLAALGARFEMSGGDIRAAALEAGFLAAGNGGVIDRHSIETAVSRQLHKRGRLMGGLLAGRPS
jgi:hypothetical protein